MRTIEERKQLLVILRQELYDHLLNGEERQLLDMPIQQCTTEQAQKRKYLRQRITGLAIEWLANMDKRLNHPPAPRARS